MPQDVTWFTGSFRPSPEVVQRRLPRLQGEGCIVSRPDGLLVRGTGFSLTQPAMARRWVLLGFGLIALALAVDRGQRASDILGVGLSILACWALVTAWRDRFGRRVDALVPWAAVERIDANDELAVLFLGDVRSFGAPVPNPVFFAPDGGSAELVAEVVARMP